MLKDGTYAAWFKTPLGQGHRHCPCRRRKDLGSRQHHDLVPIINLI